MKQIPTGIPIPAFEKTVLCSGGAKPKPGYDYVHYYTIHITASQLLNKLCNVATSIAYSCNCRLVAILRYILEMLQSSSKVTIEHEYEVM